MSAVRAEPCFQRQPLDSHVILLDYTLVHSDFLYIVLEVFQRTGIRIG